MSKKTVKKPAKTKKATPGKLDPAKIHVGQAVAFKVGRGKGSGVIVGITEALVKQGSKIKRRKVTLLRAATALAMLGLALCLASPVRAEEAPPATVPAAVKPAPKPEAMPTPTPEPVYTGAPVLWSIGPTVPFLEYDFGNPHPLRIAPGAGVQLAFTLPQLQREIGGKAWDLLNLDIMAFGSLVSTGSGQQFGALSAAVAVCTMSNLVCVGGGKHLLTTDHAFQSGGWFTVLALSINFALTPESPPVGIAKGAQGLTRANTTFMGRP